MRNLFSFVNFSVSSSICIKIKIWMWLYFLSCCESLCLYYYPKIVYSKLSFEISAFSRLESMYQVWTLDQSNITRHFYSRSKCQTRMMRKRLQLILLLCLTSSSDDGHFNWRVKDLESWWYDWEVSLDFCPRLSSERVVMETTRCLDVFKQSDISDLSELK